MKMKKTLKILLGVLGIWLLVILIVPSKNSLTSRVFLDNLTAYAESIRGEQVTREQLDSYLTHMPLRCELNHYDTSVTYRGPSDWSVRLTPHRQATFSNRSSLVRRIFLLELDRTTYPDIYVDSGETRGTTKASTATNQPALRRD